MKKEVVVIGAGGHGKVIADIIKKSGDIFAGFLDDGDISGDMLLGKVEECRKYSDKWFIIAIGNNEVRAKMAESYPELKYYTAIHPSAAIGENCCIGDGSCVMANAVINPSAIVGKHCIVNTNSTVEHDCALEDFVHISPGAILCGTVIVGNKTHIGAGAVVRNNLKITSGCTIGIGAAVVNDITETGIYVGVPAKKLVKGF